MAYLCPNGLAFLPVYMEEIVESVEMKKAAHS